MCGVQGPDLVTREQYCQMVRCWPSAVPDAPCLILLQLLVVDAKQAEAQPAQPADVQHAVQRDVVFTHVGACACMPPEQTKQATACCTQVGRAGRAGHAASGEAYVIARGAPVALGGALWDQASSSAAAVKPA